jgi:phosphoribosylglycinamide formyltransferase-1
VKTLNIAIFASGEGSNALNLFHYFNKHDLIAVKKLVCNKPDAPVVNKFKNIEIETIIINKQDFLNAPLLLEKLSEIDFIVLAGFLWLIPSFLTASFPGRIINLHPSLLPKFGGKGMYGMNVHRAVINANEKESGITIHLVNDEYDKGKIIKQYKCLIHSGDTPYILADKIHQLEQEYLPLTIEEYILSQF